MIMNDLPVLFCAIDTPDIDRALALSYAIARVSGSIKLGLEFFNAQGPMGVRSITDACPDLPLFLDLKYHDIPNTVAQAVRAAVHLQPAYLNVHASGGLEMMRAAQQAAVDEADKIGVKAPRMLAVTVLTSMDDATLDSVGQSRPAQDQVLRLAHLTQQAGLAGVVCSSHEVAVLRKECGDDFVLMVPGIRPEGGAVGDQKRVMTPVQAMQAGATHLVVGRPITGAPDPAAAAAAILASIAA